MVPAATTIAKKDLRRFLASLAGSERMAQLSDGDSLLGAGAIDSLVMVELLAFLERSYAVVIAEDELTPENFDSLDAIVWFVSRKVKGA